MKSLAAVSIPLRLMSRAMLCVAAFLSIFSHLALVDSAKSSGHKSLDTFASLPEDQWYNPALDVPSINNFIETWGG